MIGDSNQTGPLYAWLYDVDQDGKSRLMMPGNRPLDTPPGATLHVTAEGGQNSPHDRYLKVPRAEGMATEPVTVGFDLRTRYWMIRNNGRSNSLRVQQYGLAATPLYPGAAMPMSNEDVAVWIPVVNTRPRANDRSEAFRLLILATEQAPHWLRGGTTVIITAPRRMLTPGQQEAIIAYFGDHLSWPPLPAPHVRKQSEVEDVAENSGLIKEPTVQRWARNRREMLTGTGGLFTAADWYPKLSGSAQTIGDNLAAFYRLVELRTITRRRVQRWAKEHDVLPYVTFDSGVETRATGDAVTEASPAKHGHPPSGRLPGSPVAGSRVAGYLCEETVGSGGLSTVVRARDESGRTVALKLLPRDPGSKGRFAHEAHAMDAVHHPNIVRLYSEGMDDGYEFIAMQYVAGENLSTVIRREGRLPPGRAVDYLLPVASALDALHAAGVVHRDVKPDNVLVEVRPGKPQSTYLTDFGIATFVAPGSEDGASQPVLGTPHYASPEQIAGSRVDGRADQYSLACMAYVLLSGSAPFWEHATTELITAHAVVEPPRLTAIRPDLPSAANLVLAKAMAKAPEDRFDSCAAFVEALSETLGVKSPRC